MEENVTTHPVEEHEPALRLGATLREKRIALGLSVGDVASQIRLAPRQIEALEADDLAHLPELPFVRGFVRSNAKLLQLDDVPLLATLPDPHAVSERIEPVSVGIPFNIQTLSKRQNLIWLYASAAVAVIAVAFVWWQFSTPVKVEKTVAPEVLESTIALPVLPAAESAVAAGNEPVLDEPVSAVPATVSAAPVVSTAPAAMPVLKSATTLAQSAVPATAAVNKTAADKPAAAKTAAAQATPAAQAAPAVATRLRIVFDGESWTEVKDATGRLMSSRLNVAGSELNLNGQAPYELVIGNARNVHLYRRGKPVDLSKYINSKSEVARLTLE